MPQTNISMLERLLVGAFAYFQEDNETYTESNAPDVSTNYEAVPALGCIEQAAFSVEAQETEFFCPKSTGGYERTVETSEVSDYIDLTCQYYNELVHRMQFGVSAAIVEANSQIPFRKKNRRVRGWFFVHAIDQNGDTVLELKQRAEVRLNTAPPFENAYGKPVLRFQCLDNSLNTVVFGEDT